MSEQLELKKKAAINTIETVAVIGAGQMGTGIAQVFAQRGYSTLLFDNHTESLERAYAGMLKLLNRLVEKGKLQEAEKQTIVTKLSCMKSIDDCRSADLVIEAIVEDVGIKRQLFSDLDRLCKPSAILASNTSSIAITKLATATRRPELVIGMHFMNPVPLMSLVEIIRGLQTNDRTYETICTVAEHLGKTPVTAQRDFPGFIVNRMLVPMLNEAFFTLMEGVASAEEIDVAMRLGTNMPMGPLQLADFIGLDTLLNICRIFHTEFGDSKYRPCPLLVKYVEAGWLGRKSGRGVFAYA